MSNFETLFCDNDLVRRAHALIATCAGLGLRIATAESCTGGLLAGLLTEVPGSSNVVDRGFVTYSNEAKQDMLGVDPELLALYGAVSAPVARAMAEGAIAHSRAELSVAVTGIAGPGGGSVDKPVGLVHFARAERNGLVQVEERRFGDLGRASVRRAALDVALSLLEARAKGV
ncbi:MAG: damage-inducible protein CinA [Hyphomicrobiales bacterium]|nr:damage-inducible protein CinA [Hyphomicrobiales bacterium]